MLVTFLVSIFPLFWTSIEACEQNQDCPIDLTDSNIQILMKGIETFSDTLMQSLNSGAPFPTTALLSPISIYAGLVIMMLGSSGQTRDEIATALGLSQIDFQTLPNSLAQIVSAVELWRNIDGDPEQATFEQINLGQALFVSQRYTVLDAFLQQVITLGGSTESVDFANDPQGAATAINNWIANETNNRITALVSSLDVKTQLYLTGTLYFSARWEVMFDPAQTIMGNFQTSFGTFQVPMMSTTRTLLYYRNNNLLYSAVQVPYQGGDFTLIIVLPDKSISLQEFLPTFTIQEYKNMIQYSQNTAIELRTPKLNYVYAVSLASHLQSLNIIQLFTNADLSNMFGTLNESIILTDEVQSVQMTIDEYGSLIPADPNILVTSTDTPQNPTAFFVDHPYVLLIRHVQSNVIVFMATVNQG